MGARFVVVGCAVAGRVAVVHMVPNVACCQVEGPLVVGQQVVTWEVAPLAVASLGLRGVGSCEQEVAQLQALP